MRATPARGQGGGYTAVELQGDLTGGTLAAHARGAGVWCAVHRATHVAAKYRYVYTHTVLTE